SRARKTRRAQAAKLKIHSTARASLPITLNRSDAKWARTRVSNLNRDRRKIRGNSNQQAIKPSRGSRGNRASSLGDRASNRTGSRTVTSRVTKPRGNRPASNPDSRATSRASNQTGSSLVRNQVSGLRRTVISSHRTIPSSFHEPHRVAAHLREERGPKVPSVR